MFRQSLDLGYLQPNTTRGLDDIDYEALKNAPRIDPFAPPAPADEVENPPQVQDAVVIGAGDARDDSEE